MPSLLPPSISLTDGMGVHKRSGGATARCGGIDLCNDCVFVPEKIYLNKNLMNGSERGSISGPGRRWRPEEEEKCAFPVRKRIKRCCHLSRPVSRGVGNEDRLGAKKLDILYFSSMCQGVHLKFFLNHRLQKFPKIPWVQISSLISNFNSSISPFQTPGIFINVLVQPGTLLPLLFLAR